MVYMYSLTTILDEGTWSTADKPVLCEYPTIIDTKFLFRRGVRIEWVTKISDELGFSREKEGEDSLHTYELRIRSPSITDIKNIIKNMREIAHAHTHTTYASIDIAKRIKYEAGRGIITATVTALCYLIGKEI